jgi:hypothetical protein
MKQEKKKKKKNHVRKINRLTLNARVENQTNQFSVWFGYGIGLVKFTLILLENIFIVVTEEM